MKKHELIKTAYDNYPKGTKFKSLTGAIFESTGKFEFDCGSIFRIDENGSLKGNVYTAGWAEIVTDKTAVRVENELEFRALMEFYESKGFKHAILGAEAMYSGGIKIIPYKNDWMFYFEESDLCSEYSIKQFKAFAKEHGLKVPLLISEDGKVVYEGHENLIVVSIDTKEIFYEKLHKHPVFGFSEDKYKFFTTIEAAEKWIEAQKPKEKEIFVCDGIKAKASREKVVFFHGANEFYLTSDQFIEIGEAFAEFQ